MRKHVFFVSPQGAATVLGLAAESGAAFVSYTTIRRCRPG